ncbi:VOC family protein [Rubrivivax sp. A210]|uniref:VOC family protein n=1 Tax=Rubrivivax sp. A210 TaxID=2772301 RepID=UPI001919E4CA|nr:VOC family protein [Rubrivivax sp. A210]CAD5370145.1 VOC family protein [Rubrivivax sp. A210]
MAPARVDHLVVAAASLEQGVAWCEATLGATPGPGGRHALMSTHNRLLDISSANFPACYLEIIAIDPEAPPPGRVRWFGLDEPALQAQLARAPRLVHFVARSERLDEHRLGLAALGLDPGEPVAASRETPTGRLAWTIVLRADGHLLCGGALATLIAWQGVHPTARMAPSGVALRGLELRGVPAAAQALLQVSGVPHAAGPGPALQATLATPRGEITLHNRA